MQLTPDNRNYSCQSYFALSQGLAVAYFEYGPRQNIRLLFPTIEVNESQSKFSIIVHSISCFVSESPMVDPY